MRRRSTAPADHMAGPRGLEPEWAVEKYGSLTEHTEAERLRVPRFVSWGIVSIFCSLHIIGPTALGLFLCWALMCYRGANVVHFLEHWGHALVTKHADWIPRPMQSTVTGLVSTDLYTVGRSVVMCPAGPGLSTATGPDEDPAADTSPSSAADGGFFRYAFDDAGVSVVCRLCQWVDPGAVVLGFVFLMLLSLLYQSREWPLFARLFEAFHDIFDFRFVIDQSKFDPRKRYIFVAVPHGIIPLGSFMAIAFIRRFVPKLDARLGVASVLFRMPFLRQFFLWLGCVPACKANLTAVLQKPGGKVAIMSGGVAEIFLSCREREQIYLEKRKGFIRLALANNAEVVPVYIFGQTKLFDQLATNDSMLMRLSRRFAASLTCFWGRYFLPIPYPARVMCVVGDPINVGGLDLDPDHVVDGAHAAVCDAMRQIYAKHHVEAGYPDDDLEII